MGYTRRIWRLLVIALVSMAVATYMEVLIPLLIRDGVDAALAAQSERLFGLCMQILVVTLLLGVFTYSRRYYSHYFSEKAVYEIRNDLFCALEKQSYSFYDNNMIGQLMSRATTDITRMRGFFEGQILNLFRFAFLLLGVLSSMLSMDWRLAMICFALYPLIFLAYRGFYGTSRPIHRQMREQYGVLTSVLAENLTNIRIVQAFAREDYEKTKFASESHKYMDESLRFAKARASYLPFISFLSQLGTIIILWYGGQQVIGGSLSYGTLVALSIYFSILTMPVRFFGGFISDYQRAMVAATRVFEIVNHKPDVSNKPTAKELPEIKGHVRFEDVSFSYDGKSLVLDNINLVAKPGETIAILGHTGSGKSALIQLIPRFYNVNSGRILIDGYDVKEIELESLRKNISVVAQDALLFPRTIRENIAFGKPETTMEEIIKAAKAAKAHEFTSSFPDGYDSLVGERGVTLSGGQQQRIAIARALLADRKILIMDDPTSSVDVDTEFEIQQALQELLRNRTTFIVTQRVSAIRSADKIVVLKEGRIVEEGNHTSLMEKRGIYYDIYQTLEEAQRYRERGRGI